MSKEGVFPRDTFPGSLVGLVCVFLNMVSLLGQRHKSGVELTLVPLLRLCRLLQVARSTVGHRSSVLLPLPFHVAVCLIRLSVSHRKLRLRSKTNGGTRRTFDMAA